MEIKLEGALEGKKTFESIKPSLITALANTLEIEETKIHLKLDGKHNRVKRSNNREFNILVRIEATDENDQKRILAKTKKSETFVEKLNNEITLNGTLKSMNVKRVSEPVVTNVAGTYISSIE